MISWSVTVAASWLRLLRALQLTQTFGPLVLMLVMMVQDVLKYLVVNLAFLQQLAVGVVILSGRSGSGERGWRCPRRAPLIRYIRTFLVSIFR